MRKIILPALLLCLAIACKKDSGEDENPYSFVIGSSADKAGFGETPGVPAGEDLVLPKGIRLVERPNKRFDPNLDNLYGINNAFYVELNFVNDSTTGGGKWVDIPRGFCMLQIEPGIQNGAFMGRVRINVPPKGAGPGGRNDTTTIYLGMACLNSIRLVPWAAVENDPDAEMYPICKGMFQPGKVMIDPNFNKLMDILDNYDLRLKHHYTVPQRRNHEKPPGQDIYDDLQDLVWGITDGKGIMKIDLDEFLKKIEHLKK